MSGLFTSNSLANQIGFDNMRAGVPHADLVKEIEIAKLLICHLVHAQGGSFVITDEELARNPRRFILQIDHKDDPGMMVIKVADKS